MRRTILCCDIGTSSFKVALIDENAQIVCYKKIYYNTSEKNLWFNCLAKICSEIFYQIDNCELVAIGISGNGPTLVSDEKVYLWNKTQNFKKYKGNSIFLPKLLSIRHENAQIWEDTKTFFCGPEFLCWQLTGNKITSIPEERFKSSYWTEKDLIKFKIDKSKLPQFNLFTNSVGKLQKKTQNELNIPNSCIPTNGIDVFCTGSDFVALLIGTNTLFPGNACNRTGTSEGINLCTKIPLKSLSIRTLPSINSKYFNASILIDECGAKLASYKNTAFKNISFENAIKKIFENPKSKGFKLLEEMAFTVKNKIKILQKHAKKAGIQEIENLIISGNQSSIPEFLQLKANIIGIPLETTTCTDAELMGNFIVASTGLNHFNTIEEAASFCVQTKDIFEPTKKYKKLL
ncbi:MAG: hypothetical protein GX220_09390 [Treponema sp.]|nr:hypothetical protein [Treponema sp.]